MSRVSSVLDGSSWSSVLKSWSALARWKATWRVLADHHEGRQKDGFEGHDEHERRPRRVLDGKNPNREDDRVDVDEFMDPANAVILSATRN
jgi:hypothetical protein